MGLAEEERQRGRDEFIRASRQRLHCLVEAHQAAEIGERHQQRQGFARASQAGRQLGLAIIAAGAQVREDRFELLRHIPVEHADGPDRIRLDRAPELGRVIGDTGEHSLHVPVSQPLGQPRADVGVEDGHQVGQTPPCPAGVGDARPRSRKPVRRRVGTGIASAAHRGLVGGMRGPRSPVNQAE